MSPSTWKSCKCLCMNMSYLGLFKGWLWKKMNFWTAGMTNDCKNPYDNTDCYKVKQKFSLRKLECRNSNTTAFLSSPRALKRYQECIYTVCVCGTHGLFERKRKAQVCTTIFFEMQISKQNLTSTNCGICDLRKCLWKCPSLLLANASLSPSWNSVSRGVFVPL